jgi:photosystem II stability/assembly factor-like uncharacterized protein
MSLASKLGTWFRRSSLHRKRTPFRKERLRLESLEDRVVLDVGEFEAVHFASGLYYDLLNRQPTLAEAGMWSNALQHHLTFAQAAQDFVLSSEYKANVIQGYYQNYLGRAADPAGLAGWLGLMQQGFNSQNILAGFLTSSEYFTEHGSTAAGWISGLYQDLLNRSPDTASFNVWVQDFQNGLPPNTLEWAIETSPEAYGVAVSRMYHAILGRDASVAEISGWVTAMSQGLTLEGLALSFAASPEYVAQQQGVDLPFADVHPLQHFPIPNTGFLNINGAVAGGGLNLSPASGASLNNNSGIRSNVNGAPGTPPSGPAPTPVQLVNNTWVPIGPAPINGGQVPGGGAVTGRIDGLAADPTNANTIFIAAAGGGVWKTTDGGTTWTPETDNVGELTMGAIALASSNPMILYAGTGEGDNSGDSYYGSGLLLSTDGGHSWDFSTTNVFNRKAITKIAVDPSNPSTVLVAVADAPINGISGGNGIWKSTDGGMTFMNTTASISTSADYTDVVFATPTTTTPATLYMAIGSDFGDSANGVYTSTDGGNTWSKSGNFPAGTADGVIRVALSTATPTTVYASVSDPATGGLLKMEKSTDGGMTWTQLSGVPNYLNRQGFFDSTLAVDPKDANKVYAGGAGDPNAQGSEFVASTDGGNTWFDVSGIRQNNGPHADHHAIGFDANGKLLVGNDGGIWRLDSLDTTTNPPTPTWTDLNGNLNITTFVGIALDHNNPGVAYGGSQDNGREKFTGDTAWQHIQDGDGGIIHVDPNNSQTVYGEFFGISLQRSDDGGATWTDKTTGIGSNDISNFYVPFVIDPSNSNRLILGTNRVYESTNRADSWTPLSTPNSGGWNTGIPIAAVAVAANDPMTIYALTYDGKIWVTNNHGTSWMERDLPSGFTETIPDVLDSGHIAVDPADRNTAYVVRSDFNSSSGTSNGLVWKTTDGGQNWTDITFNLGNIPVNVIAIDKRPDHMNTLYIGTEGASGSVMFLPQGAVRWADLGTGLPNVRVTSIDLDQTNDILAVGTYGRGMWEFTYTHGGGGGGPGLSINDVSAVRPTTGTAPLVFTVTLGQASSQTVTVDFATQDNTALAGVDYMPAMGTLTFSPNVTTQTITVQVIGKLDPTTTTFFVNLTNPVNTTISKGMGTGTIIANTGLAINDVTGSRSRFGLVPFNFTVTLGQASSQSVTVGFTTQDSTAVANVDYVPNAGTLSFSPGVMSQTFTVQVIGSTDPNTKVFFVNLSNATNASIVRGQGIGTIRPFVPPPPADRFEPNDSSDRATNFGILPAGVEIFNNLSIIDHANGLPDVDWYRWTTSQAGTFGAQITYVPLVGTDLHMRLFMLDASGVLHQIASSRNIGATLQSFAVRVTAGETLLLWVYGFNHTQAGYNMAVDLGP